MISRDTQYRRVEVLEQGPEMAVGIEAVVLHQVARQGDQIGFPVTASVVIENALKSGIRDRAAQLPVALSEEMGIGNME